MFNWLKRTPTSPLEPDEQAFVEDSILWFSSQFGWAPLLAPVLVPTTEFFPSDWEATDEEVDALCVQLCRTMNLDPGRIRLSIFEDDADPIQALGNAYEREHSGAAGLYFHKKEKGRFVIAVAESGLADPGPLVATISHELAHVLLLGGRLLDKDAPRHEEMTDLLTIFFGLGVFTANSAFQFTQWQDGSWQGWSTRRLGYLNEPQLGFALAAHAFLRGESSPKWLEYVTTGVLHYVKQASRYLASAPEGGGSKLHGVRPTA